MKQAYETAYYQIISTTQLKRELASIARLLETPYLTSRERYNADHDKYAIEKEIARRAA